MTIKAKSAPNRLWMILELLELIDTPISLSLYLQLKNGDYESVCRTRVRPLNYVDHHRYFLDAQACALVSKNADIPTGISTAEAALKTFWEAEKRCEETNEKLWSLGSVPDDARYVCMLEKARRQIKRILGTAPAIDNLKGYYGPGATSQRSRRQPLSQKTALVVDATIELQEYLITHGVETPYLFADANADRITTVAKSSLTDRTIGIPVNLNSWYQRGLGIEIGRRLDRYRKIRLSNVPDYHAWLAHVAKDYSLATIDLSSASDMISFTLVKFLIPDDWFELLYATRVHQFEIDGHLYPYQKFSAMGNGYTFELETLIFYALCRAVTDFASTFGDDIIVPAHDASSVVGLLEFAGFSVNESKSFLTGSFYESCGSDFFDGLDVRPTFIKDLRDPISLNKMANLVSHLASNRQLEWYRDIRYRSLHRRICDKLRKRNLLCYGPYELGDSVVHAAFDHVKPPRARRGWQGWIVKSIQWRSYRKRDDRMEAVRLCLDRGTSGLHSPYVFDRRLGSCYETGSGRWVRANAIAFCYSGPYSWVDS